MVNSKSISWLLFFRAMVFLMLSNKLLKILGLGLLGSRIVPLFIRSPVLTQSISEESVYLLLGCHLINDSAARSFFLARRPRRVPISGTSRSRSRPPLVGLANV
ncbi:hypothetical protein F5Y10DRAFT_218721 [Nemania abortiva]|nr:hypothetical protein F5Y10DRAFT_218721 [Nemania abortiva]